MTANTQSECPGLCKHSPTFSNFYLFGGPKLDGSTRPGTQQTWKQRRFPFGADVNRLCRSHQQHHGAHLRAQLAIASTSPLFCACAGSDRRKLKKETTSSHRLLLYVGQYPNERDEHTKRQWGCQDTQTHTETVTGIHSWMNRRTWTNGCSCQEHVMDKNSSREARRSLCRIGFKKKEETQTGGLAADRQSFR